jgi:hypothetical protein
LRGQDAGSLSANKRAAAQSHCGSRDTPRLLLLRLLPGLLVALLATLSWVLLLLTGLLFLAALLAALVWIAHANSSIELVFNAMGQSPLECISSILVGTIFEVTR